MIVERTHDNLYLHEPRRNKEYFKMLYNEIKRDFSYKPDFKLLDIGCATGDFLYFAKDIFKYAELSGMDVMQTLLDTIDFNVKKYLGSVEKREDLPKEKYDIVTMLGIMSIFDDFIPIIDNVRTILGGGGYIYIFGIFNPDDLDVLIKARPSQLNRTEESAWESGWNLFSMKSIEMYCNENELKCEFLPFKINIEIPKNINDPLRSYTIKHNNEWMIINGLQLVHNFYLCKIRNRV